MDIFILFFAFISPCLDILIVLFLFTRPISCKGANFKAVRCTIHADVGGDWKSVFICIFVPSNPTLHITGVEWKLLKGYLGS